MRDHGLEDLVRQDLAELADLIGCDEKPMFGGLAWLVSGNLLCGARVDSLLVRLGKGRDAWALGIPDVEPMTIRGRAMPGWVRAGAEAFGEDELRRRLLDAAWSFVRELPPKA